MKEQTKRLKCSAELGYVIALILMAVGVACVARSSTGHSMISAPVYLIYTKLGDKLSYGTVEYLWQGLMLCILSLCVLRVRFRFLLSFVSAVLYGVLFDGCVFLVGLLPVGNSVAFRFALMAIGLCLIPMAVALCVRSYVVPLAYELFIKEVALRWHLPLARVKWVYDMAGLVLSIVLSLAFFGFGVFEDFSIANFWRALVNGYVIEGIGIGTLLAALINGPTIAFWGRWLDKHITCTTTFPALERLMSEREGKQ